MNQYDVVTFGAAVQDVFLSGSIFAPHCEDKTCVEEFVLGSKNDIEKVVFSTGGGATNAAVTFARQELEVAYFGSIGNDVAGQAVRHDLESDHVDTDFIHYADNLSTGFSALLLAPTGERTILTYRGASTHFPISPETLQGVRTRWIYVSALDGNFDALTALFDWAKDKGVSIAWNPGKKELEDKDKVLSLINGVNVFSVNKEEMSMVFSGDETAELLKAATQNGIKHAIITDGPNGVSASDGEKLYTAGMYEDVPVIDRTGAGDAFCSGVTAQLIKDTGLEAAITFGSANSTSVVGKIGAKAGILTHDAPLHGMSIDVKPL